MVWGTYQLRRVKFMGSGVYRNKPRPFQWAAHKQARSNNAMKSRTKVGSLTEQEVFFHESKTSYYSSGVDSTVLPVDTLLALEMRLIYL